MPILDALVRAYETYRAETLKLDHLGLPDCQRGQGDIKKFPKPDVREMNSKTQFPYVLAVEVVENGKKKLIQLKSHLTPEVGHKMTKSLVESGVHPLDIIVAKWDWRTDQWGIKNSVDYLYWTYKDQRKLNEKI